jgi:hypothetical protein
VGAGIYPVILCDLDIFADQAAEPVPSQDPDIMAYEGRMLTPGGRALDFFDFPNGPWWLPLGKPVPARIQSLESCDGRSPCRTAAWSQAGQPHGRRRSS